MSITVIYGSRGCEMVRTVLAHRRFEKTIDPSMSFGIKPNLVLAKPSHSGATTDPAVVEGIITFLKDHGCHNIAIMEGSWLGDSTARAFRICGYEELARRYQVELIDLKKDNTVTVSAGGLRLEICRSPLAVDCLINVPVLKAHCQTRLTCALKNLKGCIPDREKRRYHALGLHRPIAALSRALPQHLVVVDGIIGDLTFEEGGTPVHMHRVIVGNDPVAVDSYCASLLGLAPGDVPYISLAEELGVGCTQCEVTELNEGSQSKFSPSTTADALRLHFTEKEACSACVGSLMHALYRLRQAGSTPPSGIFIGQGFRGQEGSGIGIGSCTRGFTHHVPGCPPSAKAILDAFAEILPPIV
ncbi:MAG: DUF362 domain-containing protein [Firmicutes bacterium]|jgi:uncharacterized protein (DUF362 family)|nr:DUF362 domain-containing protein [Bacillota bacterium]